MGLDGVELIMKVEETFEINITHEDREDFTTVEKVQELIYKKCGEVEDTSCATQKAFYELRKGLVSFFNIDIKDICTQTKTDNFFPHQKRKHLWKRFAKVTELKLPDLELSYLGQTSVVAVWMLGVIVVLGLLMNLSFSLDLSSGTFSTALIIAITIFTIVGSLVLYVLVQSGIKKTSLACRIPANCRTIGELALSLLTGDPVQFKPYSKSDILIILRNILSEVTGVDEDSIRPEMRFVEDLGF